MTSSSWRRRVLLAMLILAAALIGHQVMTAGPSTIAAPAPGAGAAN
jgi:hypothetical protein